MNNTDNTYNGWTNFATWRINIEMFSGLSLQDLTGDNETPVEPEYLKQLAEEQLNSDNEKATNYAMAYINQVNWYEIAEHINEE
jgi:hypothetical protein